ATRDKPSSDAGVSPEWSLILAAAAAAIRHSHVARGTPYDVAWPAVLEIAERHGLIPLLHHVVGTSDGLPSEVARELKGRHQSNLHKSLFLARELIRIADRLDECGIEFLPYKGITLAEEAYGDMALRQSGDIDLLVRPADFAKAREAVAALGY